jgi:hypothetical protein
MHTFRIISYPPEVPMYFFGGWWGKVLFRGTPDPASTSRPRISLSLVDRLYQTPGYIKQILLPK